MPTKSGLEDDMTDCENPRAAGKAIQSLYRMVLAATKSAWGALFEATLRALPRKKAAQTGVRSERQGTSIRLSPWHALNKELSLVSAAYGRAEALSEGAPGNSATEIEWSYHLLPEYWSRVNQLLKERADWKAGAGACCKR